MIVDVFRLCSKVNYDTCLRKDMYSVVLSNLLSQHLIITYICFLQACVVKREFRKAEVLIKYAVQFAR